MVTRMVTRANLRDSEIRRFSFKINVARPTGIEPVLRGPETLVIAFSLRALEKFFLSSGCNSVNARFSCDRADDSHHFAVN